MGVVRCCAIFVVPLVAVIAGLAALLPRAALLQAWNRPPLALVHAVLYAECLLTSEPTKESFIADIARASGASQEEIERFVFQPPPAPADVADTPIVDLHWEQAFEAAHAGWESRFVGFCNSFSHPARVSDIAGSWASYLIIEKYLAKHPEALDLMDTLPVVWVTGPPRSGTTVTHQALSFHQDARTASHLELLSPVPGSYLDLQNHTAIEEHMTAMLDIMSWVAPDLLAAHPKDPKLPEEDAYALSSMGSFFPGFVCSMSTSRSEFSSKWCLLKDRQYRSYYRRLRRIYAALLHHNGGPPPGGFLLAKNPGHLLQVSSILQEFPRSSFVYLNRRVGSLVSSNYNLLSQMQQLWHVIPQEEPYTVHDTAATIPYVLNSILDERRLLEDLFASHPDRYTGTVVDLSFDKHIKDISSFSRRLAIDLKLPAFSEEAGRRLDDWTASERQARKAGKSGSAGQTRSKKTLADLGVNEADILSNVSSDYLEYMAKLNE